jgi:hypothetical protein
MLTFPLGVSVSFFDYTTKTAWILSKAATKIMDIVDDGLRIEGASLAPSPARSEEGFPTSPKRKAKPSEGLRSVAFEVGLPLTAVSPFCPLLMVGMAIFALSFAVWSLQRHARQQRSWLLIVAGGVCLICLAILFTGPMLLLWAAEDALASEAIVVSSFGFGWALLLVGSVCLWLAGVVREPPANLHD